MPDYQHLRQLAQHATPGPWSVDYAGDFGDKSAILADVLREKYGRNALSCGEDHATAEFIAAANPTVVLDLLTTIDTLVAQVRNQATDIEDTRAAYQLAQRQLNACRQGRSTYEGTTR